MTTHSEASEPWLPEAVDEAQSPEDQASCLSRYTFWWVFPSICTANRNGKLTLEDMPSMPRLDTPAQIFSRCAELWRARKGTSAKVLQTLCWSAQRRRFLSSLLHGWLFLFCMTIDPLLLHQVLESADSRPQADVEPVSLTAKLCMVVVLSISMLVRVSCMEMCYFMSARVQNNARSAMVHSIFRKAMAVPEHELDVGRITNLMATDADNIGKTAHLIWSISTWSWSFMSLPIVMYFLYSLVGSAAFVCVFVVVLSSWMNRKLGNYVKTRTKAIQKVRDKRSKMMNEMLTGIRTVKLQGWEPIWHKRLTEARQEEMRQLRQVQILQALNSLLGNIMSMLVPVCIFAWYTLEEERRLDATTAFTAMAWISNLRWSVQSLPGVFNMVANLRPSIDRIDAFLTSPVANDSGVQGNDSRTAEGESFAGSPASQSSDNSHSAGSWHDEAWLSTRSPAGLGIALSRFPSNTLGKATSTPQVTIRVQGASFGYLVENKQACLINQATGFTMTDGAQTTSETSEADFSENCTGFSKKVVLRQVDLYVPAGSFVMIAGPVGSGKSTLLASLAGARSALQGRCEVTGRRAYVSQKPFLLNASVRDNIIFGLDMDERRYEEAILLAALTEDLKALAAGHDTLVGENGVQLSGGQKARVALARAFYADADVVLLDDVLSAVDAHTGKYLWDKCLIGSFQKQQKTVVLVSHQIQYLSRPEISSVVLLRDGQIWLQGEWNDLAKKGDALLGFVQEWQADESDGEHESNGGTCKTNHQVVSHGKNESLDPDDVSIAECQAAVSQVLRTVQGRTVDDTLIKTLQQALSGETDAVESMKEGTIAWLDFKVYLAAFGSLFSVAMLFVAMLASALSDVLSNVWLSKWTSSSRGSDEQQRGALGIYASLGLVNCAMDLMAACILTICALAASKKIHTEMLQRVLSASLSFFDSNPTGRVLNRFLQDMQNIDSYVPNVLSDQMTRSLSIVTQLSLVYIEAPWVLCSLPILVIPYWMVFTRMRIPNRDSRRVESVAHSPVYAHFSDTLHGRETIRAFGAEHRFVAQNLKYVHDMATACYGNNAVQKWAQSLTTQWGCMLYFVCGIVCVLLTHSGKMTSGDMGLVLLYSAQLQRAMMDYMMGAANVENKFVSVERVAEYIRLDPEDSTVDTSELQRMDTPSISDETTHRNASWSADGGIVLRNVRMRYRLCRPLVLRGLDLEIHPKSKAAICGRTGCGKSSLFGVLSRLYPISQGIVLIGGKDISTIPLRALRSSVRVVSQDAFLLSGTLRQNLNMGNAAVADDVLWYALKAVGMAEVVEQLPSKLDSSVEVSGKNFSVGQRQLLTLARVLTPVKDCHRVEDWVPPPVLLCDEATASVDLLTDEKVHDVVLALDSTVLMICHRLQHITRFGQVVVMDGGTVVEEGSPDKLLASIPTSRLACLRAEAGVA